ncbi:YDG domain-containing protein, partial [Xanthobacter oligotrophicus]
LADVTVASKVYDGTTSATISDAALSGVIAGDTVTIANGYTATFTDPNAGTGKSVVVSELSLSGASAGNYSIATETVQTGAAITPRVLEVYGSKPEDGRRTVSGANLVATNTVNGDSVTFIGTATLASAASGTLAITNFSRLRQDNPNYTLVGAVGSVYVGSQSLVLDHVAYGSVEITKSGSATTITQTTDKAIIDWVRFSIASNESVTFDQPSSSSVTLNRVIGSEQSIIAGALNANGRVFIVNSNGVLFTAGSVVNAAALVASTQRMQDSDFLAGNYVFTVSGAKGSVVADGDIVIVEGGFLALVSENGVSTSGTIVAKDGKAILASAESLTLTLNASDPGLSSYELADLSGTTRAGGSISLASSEGTGGWLETAGTSVDLAGLTLTTSGDGTWSWSQSSITLDDAGLVNSMLGARNVALNAIDGDITVNSGISWAADHRLSLAAAGSLKVNSSIAASGTAAGLSLAYGGDYYIRTSATYAGTVLDASGIPVANSASADEPYASISLYGANASLAINGHAYTLIHSMAQFDGLDGYNASTATGTVSPASGYYALATDLDAAGTTYSGALIGTLTGTLTGLGHTISGLAITSNDSTVGLIGVLGSSASYATASVRDIGLVDVTVKAQNPSGSGYVTGVGALVGASYGNVSNAYSTGSVYSAALSVGGLIGSSEGTSTAYVTVRNVYSDANVSGNGFVAGLISRANYTNVIDAHADGNLSFTTSYSGGLIGRAWNTNVANSYATSDVPGVDANGAALRGSDTLGGLIGSYSNSSGTPVSIVNSFATGDVSATGPFLGGLVGDLSASAAITISNSYATGDVTSNMSSDFTATSTGIGGLIGKVSGYSNATVSVVNTFATGDVQYNGTYGNAAGGLIGTWSANGIITGSHATGDVTGSSSGSGAGGLIGTATAGNYDSTKLLISDSYATGDVSGNVSAGGLMGAGAATIRDVYATGNVSLTINGSPSGQAGGIIGSLSGGSITNAYATGNVSGTAASGSMYLGGLAGYSGGVIMNSRATGDVTGPSMTTGGLVGWNNNSGVVSYSTATGTVTANGVNADGLIGRNSSTGATTGNTYSSAAKARAAEAARALAAETAARQELLEAGSAAAMQTATVGMQQAADTPPGSSDGAAGKAATDALAGPSVSAAIDASAAPPASTSVRELEERERRRRQQAHPNAVRDTGA